MFVGLRDVDLHIFQFISDDLLSLLAFRLVSRHFRETAKKHTTSLNVSRFFFRSIDLRDAWFHPQLSRRPSARRGEFQEQAFVSLFHLFPNVCRLWFEFVIITDLEIALLIRAVSTSKQSTTKLSSLYFRQSHFSLAPGCRCCRSGIEKDARNQWRNQLATSTCTLQLNECTFDPLLSEEQGRDWFGF